MDMIVKFSFAALDKLSFSAKFSEKDAAYIDRVKRLNSIIFFEQFYTNLILKADSF